jgi:hypothetical protein
MDEKMWIYKSTYPYAFIVFNKLSRSYSLLSVRGTACSRGLYNPLCRLMSRPLQHSPRVSQPYCVLHTAPGSASGGHFSKGMTGYNNGNVQQFLKNTCSAY